MECAKCGEYFIGTCVSLKCYDILYNEKKELEQENRELQISCDGFAEQCSKLEAKIHNIEEGLKQLEDVLKTLNVKIGYSHHTDMYYLDGDLIDGGYVILPSATTLADLIDKLTGGE